MPVYEYRCEKCDHLSEALRRMDQADDPLACEECGHQRTRRVHSVFSPSGGSTADAPACPLPMAGCGRCGNPNGACGM